MPNIEIFTRETPKFWMLMGRFFAHRSYAQEMGGWQFYTKPGSVWFVAIQEGEVVGFCSAIEEGRYWFFDNFYVLTQHRGQGIGSILHEARMKHISKTNREIRVISNNPIQIKKYLQHGFILTGTRGRYSKYRWCPNQDAQIDTGGVAAPQPVEPEQG